MTPQRRPRDFHGRDGGAGAGRRLPLGKQASHGKQMSCRETRVADLAATGTAFALAAFCIAPMPQRSRGRARAAKREARVRYRTRPRDFHERAVKPGRKATALLGKQASHGKQMRAGNKRLAGNARRRSRRYGTAFALAAFCIAPCRSGRKGRPGRRGPGLMPQRQPRGFHERAAERGGKATAPRETNVAWGTGVARGNRRRMGNKCRAGETRVADLAATARLSRPQPSVLPPCRSGRGAAPGRRSVRRGFDTATPTPGLPWARRRSRGGKATALLGKQASHGEQGVARGGNRRRMGNKCRAGNARRRSRRYGTAFAPRQAFCIAPMPQRPRGRARARSVRRGFDTATPTPGLPWGARRSRGGEATALPRETNVAQETDVTRETGVAWKQMSCRKRASPISPLRHGFRARSLLYCPAPQRPRGRARAAKREARVRYPQRQPRDFHGRDGGAGAGRRLPPSGNRRRHGEQASRGKQTSHGKQMSRRKRASPISPLRHGFRARSLLYCPHAAATAGPRPGGEA